MFERQQIYVLTQLLKLQRLKLHIIKEKLKLIRSRNFKMLCRLILGVVALIVVIDIIFVCICALDIQLQIIDLSLKCSSIELQLYQLQLEIDAIESYKIRIKKAGK